MLSCKCTTIRSVPWPHIEVYPDHTSVTTHTYKHNPTLHTKTTKDVSLGVGNKRSRQKGGKDYGDFQSEWKCVLPWLLLVSILTDEEICPHRGSDELKTFQWKGKRLSMKFEGGWNTSSYKRTYSRCVSPEGYDMFYYKDKDTKWITHILDLQEYGVTKKWVIITEISKEVEKNNVAWLNVYTK